MSAEKRPVTVTYGDLRDGDTILDKSGKEWTVGLPNHRLDMGETTFELKDLRHGNLMHMMRKPTSGPVTVLRVESHAEELTRREAEMPVVNRIAEKAGREAIAAMEPEAIAEKLDAEVVAEETAEESDARREAEATGEPVTLPTFAEMTDLEKRSHLYLLHGVYAADVKFRERLVELHDEAHASDADRVPHTHEAGVEVSA